ncbi:MAG: DUF86 domain-containing protein [Deltaproteobacteria bacterium]|nr:DUF86 domain-containing protein [Deltaproteobacteria bacterium]
MRRDKEYLLDILGAARFALSYVGKMNKEDFLKDTLIQDAVIRRMEIIGEAARRVSQETQAILPLPWREMIGMRNLMIHEYDDIDMATVWETVRRDLSPLITELEKVLQPDNKK